MLSDPRSPEPDRMPGSVMAGRWRERSGGNRARISGAIGPGLMVTLIVNWHSLGDSDFPGEQEKGIDGRFKNGPRCDQPPLAAIEHFRGKGKCCLRAVHEMSA